MGLWKRLFGRSSFKNVVYLLIMKRGVKPIDGANYVQVVPSTKKICTTCGGFVDKGLIQCPKCGGGIFARDSSNLKHEYDNNIEKIDKKVQEKPLKKGNMKRVITYVFLILGIGILCIGFGNFVVTKESKLKELRSSYEAQLQRLEEKHQQRIQQDYTEHQRLMADQELITGIRAKQSRQQEWDRRCAYDPDLAGSAREKTILEIVNVSKNTSLPAQEILKKVAILASPKNATVDVTSGTKGFVIDVDFDMSVMTTGEEGSRTKHTTIESLKREVIEIISRVFKDLYDHCGQKEINRITVACKHGVRQLVNTVDMVIYKCSIPASDAKKIASWRRVPLHKVAEFLKVEHDEFPNLKITF